MKNLRIEYNKDEVIVSRGDERINSHSTDVEDLDKFKEWINSYIHALKQYDNKELLLNIGKEMFTWLSGKQNWLKKCLENPATPFFIEFQIPHNASKIQNAFI